MCVITNIILIKLIVIMVIILIKLIVIMVIILIINLVNWINLWIHDDSSIPFRMNS